MDASAALMNDAAKTQYTYAAQLPYLRIAIKELQEVFEQNNIPVTNESSPAVIQVDAGVTEIGFVGVTSAPNLPSDLVDIQRLWYSPRDQELWLPMTKRNFLPHYLEGQEISPLSYYTWQGQKIEILPSTTDNDIKLDYIKSLFPTSIVDQNTNIGIINAQTFLEYRTGALCAQFIGENKSRADELNVFASMAMDRATGIGTKGAQAIPIRRRPFRANYKRRGYF